MRDCALLGLRILPANRMSAALNRLEKKCPTCSGCKEFVEFFKIRDCAGR
jgi:hypothetical protein